MEMTHSNNNKDASQAGLVTTDELHAKMRQRAFDTQNNIMGYNAST